MEDFRILKEMIMKVIIVSFILILFLTLFTSSAFAAGPWKGQIIDIETKEPLEGAVVVAFWSRVWRTPAGGASRVYEVKEALTDKEGRFEIPLYTPINLLPIISYMKGPEFIIFKPGYGSLQMALEKYLTGEKDIPPYGGYLPLSGYTIRVSPGLIELPKLKTREERLKARRIGLTGEAANKTPELNRLINEEGKNLGIN